MTVIYYYSVIELESTKTRQPQIQVAHLAQCTFLILILLCQRRRFLRGSGLLYPNWAPTFFFGELHIILKPRNEKPYEHSIYLTKIYLCVENLFLLLVLHDDEVIFRNFTVDLKDNFANNLKNSNARKFVNFYALKLFSASKKIDFLTPRNFFS